MAYPLRQCYALANTRSPQTPELPLPPTVQTATPLATTMFAAWIPLFRPTLFEYAHSILFSVIFSEEWDAYTSPNC